MTFEQVQQLMGSPDFEFILSVPLPQGRPQSEYPVCETQVAYVLTKRSARINAADDQLIYLYFSPGLTWAVPRGIPELKPVGHGRGGVG